MSNLKPYMNDPDLVNEPSALREVHAIRLKIQDETKGMTPSEYNARVRERSQALLDSYGIKLQRVECPVSSETRKAV
jgi:hypothetical protein